MTLTQHIGFALVCAVAAFFIITLTVIAAQERAKRIRAQRVARLMLQQIAARSERAGGGFDTALLAREVAREIGRIDRATRLR